MKTPVIAAACLTLAGCATSSANIAATYSPPVLFSGYTCRQLAAEDQELTERVSSLTGQIDRRATNDKIAAGVAIVAFWPAAFLIKGDGEQAAEYARLKGRHEALEHAAELRGCRSGGAAVEAAATGLQPYRPGLTAASYAYPLAPPPATYPEFPRAAPPGPPPAYAEAERMRTVQPLVDNYGRQDRP